MNQIDEQELISNVFQDEAESWDQFIVDNDNTVSAQTNYDTVRSILDHIHTIANSPDNKVGFSIMRNQFTFTG